MRKFKLPNFNHLLVAIFVPFKSLKFLTSYKEFIEQTVLHRSRSHIRKVYLLNTLNLLNCGRYLFLGLYPLNDFQRLLWFNGFYFLIPKASFNLLIAIASLTTVTYNNHVLFLDANCDLIRYLYSLIVQRRVTIAWVEQGHGSKECQNPRNPRMENRIVCRYFLVMLNTLQFVVLSVGK